MIPDRAPQHPVEIILKQLGHTAAWLAKKARPRGGATQLEVRLSDVFRGRRRNFSPRDAIDIFEVLSPLVPDSGLTLQQVLKARPSRYPSGATKGDGRAKGEAGDK